jgi:hypothetical protein
VIDAQNIAFLKPHLSAGDGKYRVSTMVDHYPNSAPDRVVQVSLYIQKTKQISTFAAKIVNPFCNKKTHFLSQYKHTIMTKESFSMHGENLLNKIKELIAEGNVRKITITDKTGKELMSFPLTFGVVGVLVAPVLAAIGAVAALVGECTITVEREEKTENQA